MNKINKAPKVFISYAREDDSQAEELYQFLFSVGFQPWMDKHDLYPGVQWEEVIQNEIRTSDFFLACVSKNSVNKEGEIQREIKKALDMCERMPEGRIYLIPVRLDTTQPPTRLSAYQWVDLFEKDGWSKLEIAIREGKYVKPSKQVQKINLYIRYRYHLSLLLTTLVLFSTPWIYNNYFYRVPRPELPETCQVSQKPVQVGLAELTDCSPNTRPLVTADWNKEFVNASSIPKSFSTSSEARAQTQDFDIVVWGSCDKSDENKVELSFEIIKSRKPFEIYEPPRLHAKGDINLMSKIGKALINYQHGNYSAATELFGDTQVLAVSTDSAFFGANSSLFDGKYENAIAAFREIVRVSGVNSAAAYNNLGVAIYNEELSFQQAAGRIQSISEYSQAIELAKNIKANDVEILARVNRSLMNLQLSNWKDALSDCEAAKAVNENSAIPYICLANYSFVSERYTVFNLPRALPLNIINQYLTEAESHADVPTSIHYLRAAWYSAYPWKQKSEAVNHYALFLKDMEERACLATDKRYIAAAKYFIDANTK